MDTRPPSGRPKSFRGGGVERVRRADFVPLWDVSYESGVNLVRNC